MACVRKVKAGNAIRAGIPGLRVLIAAMVLLMMVTGTAIAQNIAIVKDTPENAAKAPLMLPYAFFNSSFGAAAGYVYGGTGTFQKQATIMGTVIAGTNSALAFYGLAREIQVPLFTDRLFADVDIALSTFGTIYSYVNGNPNYRDQQGGANDSSDNNWIRGPGMDNFARVKFRYLLPIGNGKNEVISTFVFDQAGDLVEGAQGGSSWNPFKSGKTYLEVRPFWREQQVRSTFLRTDVKTNGSEFSFIHNNTDLPGNPTKGHYFRARYTKDWGFFDSSTKYDVIDVEFSKYFSLGPSDKFRQRVIALDIWTANSPSWEDYTTRNNGQTVYERAPGWAGATLGGLFRMRAYPTGRYHDQASVYYSAEYRVMPRWNPFSEIEWVKKHLGISWWQWVPFVEAGRVAPRWDIGTLHSNMKWDVGFGVRAAAKGIVIRIDAAMAPAGNYGVQMMVGHPFNI